MMAALNETVDAAPSAQLTSFADILEARHISWFRRLVLMLFCHVHSFSLRLYFSRLINSCCRTIVGFCSGNSLWTSGDCRVVRASLTHCTGMTLGSRSSGQNSRTAQSWALCRRIAGGILIRCSRRRLGWRTSIGMPEFTAYRLRP